MGGEQRRALEDLYLQHEKALYNVAYRYVWNRDDARDVVQDAFVRLWNKRDRIDWDRASGLAFTTVIGLARNRRRGNAIRQAFSWGLPDVGSAHAAVAAAEDDAAVRRCIDALPERLRSVLVMCTFSDLDHAAIALALGVPVGTIGSRRNEAIARIRAAVSKEAA